MQCTAWDDVLLASGQALPDVFAGPFQEGKNSAATSRNTGAPASLAALPRQRREAPLRDLVESAGAVVPHPPMSASAIYRGACSTRTPSPAR